MNKKDKNELESIKTELGSIIKELESISSGIKTDFVGIGNDRCASKIDKVIEQYYKVQKKLNGIDTSSV
ncbi:MAG: hypothetical protein U0L79_09845 [Lachnospiraceae bacterium]|nr:hypothetical protein [Lachnospiraceae bacterium]